MGSTNIGKREQWDIFRRLIGYSLRYRKTVIAVFFLSILYAASAGGVISLVKPFFDQALASGNARTIFLFSALAIAAFAVKGIIYFFHNYLTRYLGQNIIHGIRGELYDHTLEMDMKFFTRQPVGDLMSRVTSDVGQVEKFTSTVLADLLKNGGELIACFTVAFILSWKLTLATLVIVPLLIYPLFYFAGRLRKYSKRAQENMAGINVVMQETFSGIAIVQAFGMEKHEKSQFKKENDSFRRNRIRTAIIAAISPPMTEITAGLGAAIAINLGGWFIGRGELSVGAMVNIIVAIAAAYKPFKYLSSANHAIQLAVASGERIFEIIDAVPDVRSLPDAVPLPQLEKSIRFENLAFSYDGAKTVLDNISIEIQRGEVIAAVGSSGAGKTTLAHLIPRFYDPNRGRITIDGLDIRRCSLQSLRAQIGIVSQETVLFHDTVRNNIAYGMSECSLEKVREAAKAAFADEFISNFPDAYDTVIGERGTRLSGGQRQRISIARALLKNPPILILDEATSALDTESETLVQKALTNLMNQRTTLVIAHRLSTIRNADRIIVLEEGKIVETGNHESLLTENGVYARLHAMQFGG